MSCLGITTEYTIFIINTENGETIKISFRVIVLVTSCQVLFLSKFNCYNLKMAAMTTVIKFIYAVKMYAMTYA